MSAPPKDPSSVNALWSVLNATEDLSGATSDCAGRFCTHGGVVAEGRGADTSGLDTEIYVHARTAFGALSFAMALASCVGLFIGQVLAETPAPRSDALRQLFLLGLSLAMFALTRVPSLCPRTVARWGHAYQVGGALTIAISVFCHGVPTDGAGQMFLPPVASWLAVWIAVFPLVAPARPWQTIGLSFASASTVPLTLVLSRLLVSEAAPFSLREAAVASAIFYASAGVAVVPALILQRISRGIRETRSALANLQTYRLIELLGQGGMGEIWRAEHRLLKREAAIKIVKPQRLEGATPAERESARARFEREATVTASLRSPHTVDLYDFGQTEDGDFYYVMELLEGRTLEELVEEHGPLPAERVVHLLLQACNSLSEAHARGLVHRDLKPGNLMACRLGLEVDFLKVLDFGLVSTNAPETRDPKLTGEDSILGTPAYMAPEQARGDGADARSDVYALGCVAYWLLTGQTVFVQEKVVPMILDHIGTPPKPPTQRTENPIPGELEAIVMACLLKEPDARPPSAGELARRLRAVPCEKTWTPERAQAWWTEHVEGEAATASDPARAPTLLAQA